MRRLTILLTLLMLPTAALATGTIVNAGSVYAAVLQPIAMAAATAAATVITAAAAYAVAWLRKKTGISGLELDAQHRAALHSALTNAAGLALNDLGNSLDGKKVDVRNPAIAGAVSYVVKSAPQALKHFNLDGRADEIAQKVVAKLPQIASTKGLGS